MLRGRLVIVLIHQMNHCGHKIIACRRVLVGSLLNANTRPPMQRPVVTRALPHILRHRLMKRQRNIHPIRRRRITSIDLCSKPRVEPRRHSARRMVASRPERPYHKAKAEQLEALREIDGFVDLVAKGQLSGRARGEVGEFGVRAGDALDMEIGGISGF